MPKMVSDLRVRLLQIFFSDFLTSNFNKCIVNSTFPDVKLANITLVHKKGAKTAEIATDFVSNLSSTSKIYGRLLFKQMKNYLVHFSVNSTRDLGEVIVHNTTLLLD